MDTVSETVSKVDEGLQEMGIDGVKDSLKDLLNLNSIWKTRFRQLWAFVLKLFFQ